MSGECQTDCGRPTQVSLCQSCLGELVADLRAIVSSGVDRRVLDNRGNLTHAKPGEHGGYHHDDDPRPGVWHELQVTLTRQHVLGGGAGVRSRAAETPVPFHVKASDVRLHLDTVITTWARDVADTYDHVALTATTTVEAAEWLATLSGLLVEHPAAGAMHHDITSAVARARRTIDKAAEQVYLGQCGAEVEGVVCTADIYTPPGRGVVQCPDCGTTWEMSARRDILRRAAEDVLATAVEASRAMPFLMDGKVNVNTIRWWAHTGRLHKHPPLPSDERQRPRYRVGDILDLATSEDARKGRAG